MVEFGERYVSYRDKAGVLQTRKRTTFRDADGVVRDYYKPKGTRVSLRVETGLATKLALHAKTVAQMEVLLAAITARAQATVPVGDGRHRKHLRDTLLAEVQITPKGPVLLIGYTAWWAHFVHNGTVRRPADPWLLNAALSVLVTGRARKAA